MGVLIGLGGAPWAGVLEPWHGLLPSQHIALCTNHLLSSFFFGPHPPTSLHFQILPKPPQPSGNWWAGGAWSPVGAAGRMDGRWARSQGRSGEGGLSWGRAAILAAFPSPRAGAAPSVLLDGRAGAGRGVVLGTGQGGRERLGEGGAQEEVVCPGLVPGGTGFCQLEGAGGWRPPQKDTGCARGCTWVSVHGSVSMSVCACPGLALLKAHAAG